MNDRSAPLRMERYTRVAMTLHWLIAAMILTALTLGLFHESVFEGVRWTMPVHKALGLTVLALSVVRLGWRITHPAPPLPQPMSTLHGVVAHGLHWLLYALMFLLPLTGWLMVSGSTTRRPLTWFGLFDLPYLPVGKALGGLGHDVHGLLGYLMTALVIGHVGAALYHHFVLKDVILARMLPGVRAG